MANSVGWLVNLKDKFSGAAKKVAGSMGVLERQAGKTNRKVAGMGAGLDKLGGQLKGALAFAGVSVGIGSFLQAGAAFQDGMADISAITGAAGKDLAFYQNEILTLSKEFATAQTEVATAVAQIGSAKSELLRDPEGLINVTRQVLTLANAAGVSIPDAIDASVGALNQFNLGADQASRFVNSLAAGSQVGASLVGEMVQALKNAGSVSAQFGLSFEETNATLQVFAKNGIKGSEAGTLLRATLSKLESIRGGRFAPSKIGFIKSLEVIEKLGLSNVQILNEFGAEVLKGILILRSNVPLVKQWTAAVTGTNTAQEQAAVRLATFNAGLRRLGVIITDKVIKTFIRLEPVLTRGAESFGAWLDTVDDKKVEAFADSIKGILQLMEGLAKAGGAVADVMGRVGTAIGETAAKIELKTDMGRGGLVSKVSGAATKTAKSEFSMGDFTPLGLGLKFQRALVGEFLSGGPATTATPENLALATGKIMREPAQNAKFNGELVIRAKSGTEIMSMKNSKMSENMNFGLNMVTQ